jgi:hypothetical protein
MSAVRLLVGRRKGAFVLASDGRRERWDISGPRPGRTNVGEVLVLERVDISLDRRL